MCTTRGAPPDISPEWASRALLFDVISRIVAPEETGAYVTQSHAHVVRVVDLRVWRSEFTALLALLRPRASVCVSGCGDSMTGLEVLFCPLFSPRFGSLFSPHFRSTRLWRQVRIHEPPEPRTGLWREVCAGGTLLAMHLLCAYSLLY